MANAAVLHYLFSSEVDEHARSKFPWRQLRLDTCTLDTQPLRTWEDVRYVLELKAGLHGATKCSRGFLSAMRRATFKEAGCVWDASKRLQPSDVVQHKDALIVFRRPLPRALRPWVPPRFDPDQVEERMKATTADQERLLVLSEKQEELMRKLASLDEDARLLAVATGAADVSVLTELVPQTGGPGPAAKRKKLTQHADEYEFERHWLRPVPPADYECKGCSARGAHFRADCPREALTVHVATTDGVDVRIETAVDKIQLSHGIPKMFLKKISTAGAHDSGGSKGIATRADVKEALTTREGDVVVDVRASLAKPVIEIAPDEVLRRMQTRAVVVDDDDMWFSFEPYLAVHDELYAEKLEKVHQQLPHLRRKLQSMCTHWLRGICHKGVLCEYLHVYSNESIPICKFYLQGKCLNDECIFRHVLPPSAHTRRRVCLLYATGFCPHGPACGDEHVRRDAPYIADFPNKEALFNAVVHAFDAFTTATKQEEVRAKKQYALTPAGSKRLHSTVQSFGTAESCKGTKSMH